MNAFKATAFVTRMLTRRIVPIGAILLVSFAASASPPSYSNKLIDLIQPDHPSSNCFYFTLQGVDVADSTIGTTAWFAVDRTTHKGATELYSTLLAAKASGLLIDVWTTGTAVCGYPGGSFAIAH